MSDATSAYLLRGGENAKEARRLLATIERAMISYERRITDRALYRLLRVTYAAVLLATQSVSLMTKLLDLACKRKAKLASARLGKSLSPRIQRRKNTTPFHVLLGMAACDVSRQNISRWSTALKNARGEGVEVKDFDEWIQKFGVNHRAKAGIVGREKLNRRC